MAVVVIEACNGQVCFRPMKVSRFGYRGIVLSLHGAVLHHDRASGSAVREHRGPFLGRRRFHAPDHHHLHARGLFRFQVKGRSVR
jgi:hypothetical protein